MGQLYAASQNAYLYIMLAICVEQRHKYNKLVKQNLQNILFLFLAHAQLIQA